MFRTPNRLAFASRGVVVYKAAFSPTELMVEVARALDDGHHAPTSFVSGQSGFYCPMLGDHTPVSVSLVERFAVVAASLLGRDVLPVRAKAVTYAGETGWHVDSVGPPQSLGFIAYLSPLRGDTGALRVRPGSHADPRATGEEVLVTEPGDVIVLDERVAHASFGGRDRRQWRIDYVVAPGAAEEESVRAYYAALFPPRARPPYDASRYPSYGAAFQASHQPWVQTMRRLGVFAAAAEHELEPS